MKEAAENISQADQSRKLSDAIRDVKNAFADRDDVVVDMREAHRMRLELLAAELAPIFADVPADMDNFDFAVSSGLQPRLWIDAVSHVAMGRDRRTYRFLKDTRIGRVVLAEIDRDETGCRSGDALRRGARRRTPENAGRRGRAGCRRPETCLGPGSRAAAAIRHAPQALVSLSLRSWPDRRRRPGRAGCIDRVVLGPPRCDGTEFWTMILKSGNRFSEKIMVKQKDRAPSRSSGWNRLRP